MRVIGSVIILLAVAIAIAGCAQQPAAYAYRTAPAAAGIDNVVYGPSIPSTPAKTAASAPDTTASTATASSKTSPASLYAYAPADVPAAPEGHYTLDSGDRMRIVVFGQDGLTNSYIVGAGGHIDMPLIGSVSARGATTDQLADRIASKLRDGYIREPHVAVEIEAYRPFFILGEVTQPGQYPYVANMTAETAVAIAGGFTPRAFRRNVVVNRNYNGLPTRMAVPLTFPLRPGDTINVQERWF
jgi:polysaccharide export outer membrane protein